MKILVAFDGSDDGFEGLKLAATFLVPTKPHSFMLVVVGWPPRLSPIWDKAYVARVALDDLHRAMAEVADQELRRLKELFEPLGTVTVQYTEGDPADELVTSIGTFKPDLVVAGLTRGRHRHSVHTAMIELLGRTNVPTVSATGIASG